MRERIRQWYRNLVFRKRVLYSHLAVSLIPVIILGAFCYIQTRNLLINREKEVLRETLEQSVITLDSTLDAYKNVMDNLTWDAKIKEALAVRYENNFQMYLAYRDIIDPILFRIRSLNPKISHLTIYSSNATLFSHGDYLKTIEDIADLPEETKDYQIHWKGTDNGRLELYCEIYPDTTADRNVVWIDVDYNATFVFLKSLFGDDYGVKIADEAGGTVFSWSSIDGIAAAEELCFETETACRDYVMEKKELSVNGWTMWLYRPLKTVSQSASTIPVLIGMVVIFCMALILLAGLLLTKSVVSPLGELIRNIDQIQEGHLSVEVEGGTRDEIGHLITRFGKMMERLDHMVNEVYKSKILQQQYEMKALQAQINPHFLYNSLSLINWKAIMAGQEEIGEMARLLSVFYRTTLNKGKNVIDVKGEWDNTCSYIRIQNMMHSQKLTVRTQIDEGMFSYQMLNLLLQPLVENAIAHGLDHKTGEGERILEVTGREEETDLVFTVSDNGCGIPLESLSEILTAESKGYGVQNVHHRIQLFYGNAYGLSYESQPGVGTRVTVRIPKVWKETAS